jgi:hypothetical protein
MNSMVKFAIVAAVVVAFLAKGIALAADPEITVVKMDG